MGKVSGFIDEPEACRPRNRRNPGRWGIPGFLRRTIRRQKWSPYCVTAPAGPRFLPIMCRAAVTPSLLIGSAHR